MKKLIFLAILILSGNTCIFAQAQDTSIKELYKTKNEPPEDIKKIVPPKKIFYDNKELKYNSAWKNKEIYLEANLDNDTDNEIIISFVATYKPEEEINAEDKKTPYKTTEKKIVILQNYVFYQIYDKVPGGNFKLIKTISGMDRPGEIKIFKLDKNSPNAIAILSPGGEHYTDLSVYQFKNEGYGLLFNKGSSETIKLISEKIPPEIQIGTNRPEIFIWDNNKNSFKKIINEV